MTSQCSLSVLLDPVIKKRKAYEKQGKLGERGPQYSERNTTKIELQTL